MGAHQDIKSSLPLEIALYFNRYYSVAFVIVTLLLFIYKGVMLPYPPNAIGLEVAFVFMYAIIEYGRISLASRGNKTELIGPLLMALALFVPVVVLHAYYVSLQTYVLRLDVILNGIALAFCTWEALFGLLACASFWSAQRY